MTSALARQRVTLCKEGLPERTVWLVLKQTRGAEPTSSYSISHAPVRTPRRTFIWRRGRRGAIEQCCEEGTTARGMAHYAGRQYPGWHHHMLTTMLAHCFLWHLKRRWGENSARADGSAAAEIIGRRLALAQRGA